MTQSRAVVAAAYGGPEVLRVIEREIAGHPRGKLVLLP